MADMLTVTVGTTDYTFDWIDQNIHIEAGVVNVTAADLKTAIKDAEDSEVGMPYPPIAIFFNPVTLTPTTSTFLNVVLQDQWRVESFSGSGTLVVAGGNVVNVNNGIDIFVPNVLVNMINNTSAAGVLVAGDGMSAAQTVQLSDVHGGIQREIWLDTSLVSNGNGYQQSPYNNLTDAIDDGEANGITALVILDDVTLDRPLKNFNIRGIGVPTIDTAGYDLKGVRFYQVKLEGTYTSEIIAQECVLLTNAYLNGNFEKCALAGDLFCVAGGTVFMTGCGSAVAGLGRPTITMSSGGARVLLSVRDNNGGMTIKGCTHVNDEVTVEVNRGSLTFDASNTAGSMVARTSGKFVDATAGATVTNENYAQETWQAQKMDPNNPVETDEDGTIRVAGKTIGASTVGTTPNRTTTQTRTG